MYWHPKEKNWITHLEIATGNTPDISMFRFHFWEPVWYFEPTKSPLDNWKKGRFLGFAETTGDLMTYWIETEGEPKPKVLARSGVRTRRNIEGLDPVVCDEETSEDLPPEPLNLPLPKSPEHLVWMDKDSGENEITLVEDNKMLECTVDDDGNDDFFQTIVGHEIRDGELYLQVNYNNENKIQKWTVPFKWIKNDVPIEVAHYIKNHVSEAKRRGAYSNWANRILQTEKSHLHRVLKSHGINDDMVSTIRRHSKNSQKRNRPDEIKFGYRIPKSVKSALLLDKENGNSLWREVIDKEMKDMDDYD